MGGVYNVSQIGSPTGTIPVIGTTPSWRYPLVPGSGPNSSNIVGIDPTKPIPANKLSGFNASHQALLMLGAEVLFVVALAAVAEYDQRWSHVAAGTLIILWLLFLINHANDLGRWFAQLGG